MEQQDQHIEQQTQTGKKMMHRYIKIIATLFLVVAVFWIGFERGASSVNNGIGNEIKIGEAIIKNDKGGNSDKEIDFALFWNVWSLLKEKYVDAGELDAQKLYFGAIKGMMQATGDPYTTFFDPTENKQFNEDITGSFEGIGAELGVKNGILTVIAPLEGTPAEKAGLRAGDKIVKIDGKTTTEMSIEDAVSVIRGPRGSSVLLTIFRNGEEDTQDIKVDRNVINVKSVKLEMKEGNIAYIKITRFGDDTNKAFTSAINSAVAQDSKGLILDLRNNPGGYLQTSIEIASKMLPKNKVVVIEEDSKKNQDKMMTLGGDVASSLQTVILINEGSASASEILAGALRENRDNVTLVGKKSFGKGSVQEFIDLTQGTAAKITVARWLTPTGKQINEQGISPDVEIDLTNDDYQNDRDPQLDQALKTLNEKLQQ